MSSQVIFRTRGIRQGDPISPYLYLISVEGLSSLLYDAERCSKIKGLRVARNSLTINDLFFIDDSIVFCRVTINDWQKVQKVLKIYETAASQGFNLLKT